MSHWLQDFLGILWLMRPLKPPPTSSYGFSIRFSGRLLELWLRVIVGTTLGFRGAVWAPEAAGVPGTMRWPDEEVGELGVKLNPDRGNVFCNASLLYSLLTVFSLKIFSSLRWYKEESCVSVLRSHAEGRRLGLTLRFFADSTVHTLFHILLCYERCRNIYIFVSSWDCGEPWRVYIINGKPCCLDLLIRTLVGNRTDTNSPCIKSFVLISVQTWWSQNSLWWKTRQYYPSPFFALRFMWILPCAVTSIFLPSSSFFLLSFNVLFYHRCSFFILTPHLSSPSTSHPRFSLSPLSADEPASLLRQQNQQRRGHSTAGTMHC